MALIPPGITGWNDDDDDDDKLSYTKKLPK